MMTHILVKASKMKVDVTAGSTGTGIDQFGLLVDGTGCVDDVLGEVKLDLTDDVYLSEVLRTGNVAVMWKLVGIFSL